MCAIFGYVARAGHSIDLGILRDIVRTNIIRGPHAFGFAWIDQRGRLRCFKQTGRLTDELAVLAMARDARMLVGHLRYATHGRPEHNVNNHPHPSDGGWIVHNGVVHNQLELIDAHDLAPVSSCDSEVIGLLLEQLDGSLAARAAATAEQLEGPAAILGLWSRPNSMLAIRRGNPLNVGTDDSGLYLATIDDALPDPREVPDGSVLQLSLTRGRPMIRVRARLRGNFKRRTLFDAASYRGG